MSTVNYQMGWKFYIEFVSLEVVNGKYINLPQNSTFEIPYGFQAVARTATGGTQILSASDMVFSGYDMSTVGFQNVTVTYNAPNGTVLTDTITLHVFGDTTWRTIWEGTEAIEMTDGTYKINDVDVGQNAYACACDPDTFEHYIGAQATRTIRLTFTVETSPYLFYLANEYSSASQYVTNVKTMSFNWLEQQEGPVQSGSTTYGTVYKTIGIDKFQARGQGAGGPNYQIVVGQLNAYQEDYLLFFRTFNRNNPGTISGASCLCGQNITILKIEVLE